MTAATVSPIRSIQAEQLLKAATAGHQEKMDAAEVDNYVRSHSDGVLDCRQSYRHMFEQPRRGENVFNGGVVDGKLCRRKPCLRCGLVDEVQLYETRTEGRGDNKRYRYTQDKRWIDYNPPRLQGTDRERYLVKGQGRMRPSQLRDSRVSYVLEGIPLTEVKRMAREALAAAEVQ